MVQLDHQLIHSAHQLCDGSNVESLKELIFAYEQAVDLHNRQWPRHEIYRIQSELSLRKYVRGYENEILREEKDTAIRLADSAIQLAKSAQSRFDSIE